MTELERHLKERIDRLMREIEARNAACKQYAHDIACLTDQVRALHVKIDNLTSFSGKGGRDHHGH
jgi:hypothetical protein